MTITCHAAVSLCPSPQSYSDVLCDNHGPEAWLHLVYLHSSPHFTDGETETYFWLMLIGFADTAVVTQLSR